MLYHDLEAMSDEQLEQVIAAATYTRMTRRPVEGMDADELVAVTDAARALLRHETDEGARNALLDAINTVDTECRRRNAIVQQRIDGVLAPGSGRVVETLLGR